MRKPVIMERTLAGLRELVASTATTGDGRLPSERDLSERFGVSQSTMKKALYQLKEEGLIDSRNGLGYFVLSRVALSGAKRGGGMVGVVLLEEAHLVHPVAMARVRGVQSVLQEAGYSTVIISRNRLTTVDGLFSGVWSWSGYAGVVVLDGSYDVIPDYWNDIARNVPLVLGEADIFQSTGVAGLRLAAVSNDYSEGHFLATSHLIAFGHRRIAVLLFEARQFISRRCAEGARLARAVSQVRDEVELLTVYCGAYDPDVAQERMRHMLALDEPPTAFLLGADDFLRGADHALRAIPAAVRQKIAIISVNGVDIQGLEALRAGSVTIDFQHFGRRCAQVLLDLIASQSAHKSEFLPIKFIPGGLVPG